jgi:hypothetical protein
MADQEHIEISDAESPNVSKRSSRRLTRSCSRREDRMEISKNKRRSNLTNEDSKLDNRRSARGHDASYSLAFMRFVSIKR